MKYLIYLDKRGEWRFRLQSRNGRTLLNSEGYTRKENLLATIKQIKEAALDARVYDLVLDKEIFV